MLKTPPQVAGGLQRAPTAPALDLSSVVTQRPRMLTLNGAPHHTSQSSSSPTRCLYLLDSGKRFIDQKRLQLLRNLLLIQRLCSINQLTLFTYIFWHEV